MKALPRNIAFALAAMCWSGCSPQLDTDTSKAAGVHGRKDAHDALLDEGRRAYINHCAGCHGETGDGNGLAAGFLSPRPRNLQRAAFKFSSTRAGHLPTDEDLKRTIRQGLRGTAMPDWPLLSEQTVDSLIVYIKTLSPKWQEKLPAPRIPLVDDPYRNVADKSAGVQRGQEVYHGYAACWSCHAAYVGERDINQYLAAAELPTREGFRPNMNAPEAKVSSEGEWVYPPDFRRDFVRGGMTVDDLYRSIAAGITGTAMPTWVDAMDLKSAHGDILVQPADLWAMAYYVRSLMQERPALLDAATLSVRSRAQTLYFNGEIPPPVEEPKPAQSTEEFED